MDEKESETSNVALTDVFLNTTNPDGYSLIPDKTSVGDLTEDRLLSSDTKPSDMLTDNTFDKDQFEELPISLDTDKDTCTVLQEGPDETIMDTTVLQLLNPKLSRISEAMTKAIGICGSVVLPQVPVLQTLKCFLPNMARLLVPK
eukprot:XP_014784466.1 PREDICTED: uncharacterized protein LOC106879424 [Octopus bimaculoides]